MGKHSNGIIAQQKHDGSKTTTEYIPAPASGSGKHYNPNKKHAPKTKK